MFTFNKDGTVTFTYKNFTRNLCEPGYIAQQWVDVLDYSLRHFCCSVVLEVIGENDIEDLVLSDFGTYAVDSSNKKCVFIDDGEDGDGILEFAYALYDELTYNDKVWMKAIAEDHNYDELAYVKYYDAISKLSGALSYRESRSNAMFDHPYKRQDDENVADELDDEDIWPDEDDEDDDSGDEHDDFYCDNNDSITAITKVTVRLEQMKQDMDALRSSLRKLYESIA